MSWQQIKNESREPKPCTASKTTMRRPGMAPSENYRNSSPITKLQCVAILFACGPAWTGVSAVSIPWDRYWKRVSPYKGIMDQASLLCSPRSFSLAARGSVRQMARKTASKLHANENLPFKKSVLKKCVSCARSHAARS